MVIITTKKEIITFFTNNTIEESEKGGIKIKKIKLVLILILFPINITSASEYPDITSDVEIRYKWYKEIITGDYYPKKDIKAGDLIDEKNIKYGRTNELCQTQCSEFSEEYYKLEKELINVYKKVDDVRYILFENFEYKNNINIYHNTKKIKFEIINNENNKLLLDLKDYYMNENLLFIVDNAQNYKISFFKDSNLKNYIISKELSDEKIFSPDKTWITSKTKYLNYHTEKVIKNSDFITKTTQYYRCRYHEIYVYKYEIQKEYYDDNYHLNIEGYMKDKNDYKVFYKGIPITNTIEITKEKIVKEPKYIYIENKDEKKEDDSSKKETICIPKIKTKVKKEIIEKEILKTPKKIYITILLLSIIILILTIKILKNMSFKKNN